VADITAPGYSLCTLDAVQVRSHVLFACRGVVEVEASS
jgi:hypothetical protein